MKLTTKYKVAANRSALLANCETARNASAPSWKKTFSTPHRSSSKWLRFGGKLALMQSENAVLNIKGLILE
jgi:hypothetical protein